LRVLMLDDVVYIVL